MTNLKTDYLTAMGIEVWQPVDTVREGSVETQDLASQQITAQHNQAQDLASQKITAQHNQEQDLAPQSIHEHREQECNKAGNQDANGKQLGWDELQKQAAACCLCGLSKTRSNVVFGVGNRNADVMLIGEAPGANEDLHGEPFVGRAGMLLNAMLQAIGLQRQEVYIANILKCRPPNNRDPLPEEVALCTPYLRQQIALIKPKVIIAVGRIAAQALLNTTESMSKLRAKQHQYGALHTPLFVIYHPAYLLRSPREKSKAYDDLLLIKQFLQTQS